MGYSGEHMRTALCINNLPPQANASGFEPVNFSYHPQPWKANPTTQYVRESFGNGVAQEYASAMMCLDYEPAQLWSGTGAAYQSALNIGVDARQKIRSAFPGRELWCYDLAGGFAPELAIANACAARQAADGFDGLCIGFYCDANGEPQARHWEMNHHATQMLSARCWPMPKVGIVVTPHPNGGGELVSVSAFSQSVKAALDAQPDMLMFWQAKSLLGVSDEKYAAMLEPYLEIVRQQ